MREEASAHNRLLRRLAGIWIYFHTGATASGFTVMAILL